LETFREVDAAGRGLHSPRMAEFARVIVEVARNREFDYRIPEALREAVHVGSQVIVPFGKSEARGYVVALPASVTFQNLKEIRDVAGRKAVVSETMLKLARWMADYYLAPYEISVRTVLPSAVRKKGAAFVERLQVVVTEKSRDAAAVLELRKRAPKQAAALDILLGGGPAFLNHLAQAAHTSPAAIHGLEAKGFVQIAKEKVTRDPLANLTFLRTEAPQLMPQQEDALKIIRQSIETLAPPVVLLFGVTGSGKTEVYLQAIKHTLARGQGAIVLVPEIALTPQTIERFRGRFGEDVAVLHSRLSQGERHDEWHRIHDGVARIVVGPRSAVFAPVHNLGLIVVDEEHEPSYKQEEAPRYNARDVAVVRGRLEKCAVVLGSATPALESFHNVRRGKYALAELPARVDHRQMPVVRVVDMRIEAEREGRPNIFSRDLIEAIRTRIERAEQTMLFLNRRGYASQLICPKCGFVAQCRACSVALTYHKSTDELLCHICGARQRVPERCPAPKCGDPAFKYAGLGTQRVEVILHKLFPIARVTRMDSDTTTQKGSHRRILNEFRGGKIDVLVGTQMIAKGLDFPNVTLVGVVFADMSLHKPDFRAAERTFQLLTQVAGRAGRGDLKGEVFVQTYTPHHPAIQAARRLDYTGFMDQEFEARRELNYPPFTHLVVLTLKGASEQRIQFAGEEFVKQLQPLLGSEVIMTGPMPAPLARAKGLYRFQILLRAPLTRQITEPLKQALAAFKWPKDIECAVDVDALQMI
jgi:primosomal protein N' (replication factor Y)